MSQIYNVDFSKLIYWIIIPQLRTAFNLEFLNALVTPLLYVYNQFTLIRNNTDYTLEHNGQVCYMRGVLNDNFDIEHRSVEIINAGGVQIIPLYTDADLLPVIIGSDANAPMVIEKDSGYNANDFDFIVKMPYPLSDSTIYQIRALVDFYKLAGKRYDIDYPILSSLPK